MAVGVKRFMEKPSFIPPSSSKDLYTHQFLQCSDNTLLLFLDHKSQTLTSIVYHIIDILLSVPSSLGWSLGLQY